MSDALLRRVVKDESTLKLLLKFRDLLAFVAFVRYGNDLYHALEELGLLGLLKAIILYPVVRVWNFSKRNIPQIKRMFHVDNFTR
jgi:hypothetical protein